MVNTRRYTPGVQAPVDGLGEPLAEGKPNPFFVGAGTVAAGP